MAQYINKAALVAEIERRKYQFVSQAESFRKIGKEDKESYFAALASNMNSLLSFLDTLEVKDVNIEDAIHGTVDYPLIGCDFPNIYPNYKELKEYCDRKGIKDNDKVKLIIIKDICRL